MGVTNRQGARDRLYRQVRDRVDHPDWQHMKFLSNGPDIFVEAFRHVAHWGYPLYIPLQKAGELVKMHNVAAPRRAERHYWTLGLPHNTDLGMQEYRRALFCKIRDDYHRNLRHWAAPQAASDD